jgi:hypothetical protein
VSSAGGGLPGKVNGIDKRGDAFQIALERSFQSPAPNSGGHCPSTWVGVACAWVGGCHASGSRSTRMDASFIGTSASSTDSRDLLRSGSGVRNPTGPAVDDVAMQLYRVRPADIWPAQAIGPLAVDRDTRQARPGHSEVACPSRLRRPRTCQVERPAKLAADEATIWQVPVVRHRVRAAGSKATTPCCVLVPWFDGQAAEESPTSERSALLASLQSVGG